MNLNIFHNDCDFKLNETASNCDIFKDGRWLKKRGDFEFIYFLFAKKKSSSK